MKQFEKVNPMHPDKIADRIAGALVDIAYNKQNNPKVAIETLIGHNKCYIIAESSYSFTLDEVKKVVKRIAGLDFVDLTVVPQDIHLAENQNILSCGDNGIFKGVPTNDIETKLSDIAKTLYDVYKADGKYVLTNKKLIICQSNAEKDDILSRVNFDGEIIVNPLGFWTGGLDVDTGATNRKLGSDMGRCVTGGGIHGKDCSKADVSVNIYAYLKAQETGKEINLNCAIGDKTVDGVPYKEIVDIAKKYIDEIGGFEKLAEWGLVL